MRISDWSQTCALPISGAGPVAQAQSAPTIGQPLEAGVLDALRGGESVAVVSVKDDGEVSGNHAENITSGPNAIDGGAFANTAGITTVIQNSGSNVLIQNGNAVNVQFVDPPTQCTGAGPASCRARAGRKSAV